MKTTITVTTAKKLNIPDLRKRLVGKLNSLVGATGDFFEWKRDNELRCCTCSNVHTHNRLVLLLALFIDSNYDEYACFTSFGYNGMIFNLGRESFLPKLFNFVNDIDDLRDVSLKID